jgi:type IV pilus assembly protein PilM
MADEKSIWKKEITLRRKRNETEQGERVPPAPTEPAKPESVAELLRPLAEQTVDPLILPPVTPHVSTPMAPPPLPPVVEPPVEAPPGPAPAAPASAVPVAPEPAEAAPAAVEARSPEAPSLAEGPKRREQTPVSAPDPSPRPKPVSKRGRKKADQAAERTAKARRRPHAAQNKIVGLKIGATHLAAAQIVNKGGPKVVRVVRSPLQRGVVVGGELREPEELAAALKAFFRKSRLPRNCIRLGISNNRIGVRTFEISGIDDPKQLSNAIRFRAQETLPIPLDEAVLDYRILEDRVGADGVRTRRVLLVVAHRELVERYLAACRKAGLKLIGIDLEAFALLRALGDPAGGVGSNEDAALVCVSIGHDRSTLAVSNGEICEFNRVLSWGGASLDLALARALDLTPSEAEPLKRALALGEEGEVGALDGAHAETARKAMVAELQNFARELVASLRFYQEQPGSLGIGEIVLTGGGAACRGLAEELQGLIGVTVRIGDPLGRVKVPRKVRKTTSGSVGSLAVAVGLGIED